MLRVYKEDEDILSYIKHADTVLYDAKTSWRNRVVETVELIYLYSLDMATASPVLRAVKKDRARKFLTFDFSDAVRSLLGLVRFFTFFLYLVLLKW